MNSSVHAGFFGSWLLERTNVQFLERFSGQFVKKHFKRFERLFPDGGEIHHVEIGVDLLLPREGNHLTPHVRVAPAIQQLCHFLYISVVGSVTQIVVVQPTAFHSEYNPNLIQDVKIILQICSAITTVQYKFD